MGHVRLGRLPRSRDWQKVVGLITDGSDLTQIAAASADAADRELERASQDTALVQAFWLLTQIPQAARSADFAEGLNRLGVAVSANPTLMELAGAVAGAIDDRVRETGRVTDLGEMAQLAATETLSSLVGRDLPTLFGSTADDVQQAVAKLGTSDRFSVLARDFFSRLTHRCLSYFLSRELSDHVGPGKRFADVAAHRDFNAALDLHCREASRIIKEFSGGWYGKTLFREGDISPEKASQFAHVAFKKLRSELRKRRDVDA